MRRRRPDRGLTLAEILVSMAILSLLSLVLLRIYDVSRAAYATGVGRLGLQQKARQTVQRLASRLTQAIPASDTQDAVFTENAEDPKVTDPLDSKVVYTIPARPFDPRAPVYRKKWILYRHVTGLVTTNADNPADPDLVLARDVDWLELTVLPPNAVRITVVTRSKARTVAGGQREQDYRLQTVIQIPYYATR